MDFFGTLAKWFTDNEGGLSVLLSALAVVISLLAIGVQNKGVLFEKRAAVYYEVGAIYKKLYQELETDVLLGTATYRFFFAVNLFPSGSEEYGVFEELHQLEQEWEAECAAVEEEDRAALEEELFEDERAKALRGRYTDIYRKKHLENHLIDETELLYGKDIATQVLALYRAYDFLVMMLPILTHEELEDWVERTRPVLREFEAKRVLGRMKRRLPR